MERNTFRTIILSAAFLHCISIFPADNYTSYVDAKDLGRTQKTWLTMLDKKVRDTHEELEGQTIGIDDYFQVGNSQMLFPLDWSMSPNPRETINGRCAVEYK